MQEIESWKELRSNQLGMSSVFSSKVFVLAGAIGCGLAASADLRAEDRWSLDAGVELVVIDGVMDHAAMAGLWNDQKERWVPRLNLGYRATERTTLKVGFIELRDIGVSGAAGCSAPWLEPGEGCYQVITPIRMESDLQQFDFGVSHRVWSGDRSDLTAGVSGVLSVVSNSRFWFTDRVFSQNLLNYQAQLNARYVHDETQWDLGGHVSYARRFAENWEMRAGYRLTQPPGRTLHHLGLSLGARF